MMPYTSGSTGQPKGCMHTHATVLHNVAGAAAWKHIGEDVMALATAPFFHVTGLVHSFFSAIYAGGTMVIQRRWDPLEAARLVERYQCTHWDNVPTMVVDLLSHPQALKHDVTSLKWIFGGGAAMPEAIAQKLYDLRQLRDSWRRRRARVHRTPSSDRKRDRARGRTEYTARPRPPRLAHDDAASGSVGHRLARSPARGNRRGHCTGVGDARQQ